MAQAHVNEDEEKFWTEKDLYWKILETPRFAPHLTEKQKKWKRVWNWDPKEIARRLQSLTARTSIVSLMWKIVNGTLPISKMHRDPCPFCKVPEKTAHIFVKCPMAMEIVQSLGQEFQKLEGRPLSWTKQDLYCLGSQPQVESFELVFRVTTISAIWANRNGMRHPEKGKEARKKSTEELIAIVQYQIGRALNNKNRGKSYEMQTANSKSWHSDWIPKKYIV